MFLHGTEDSLCHSSHWRNGVIPPDDSKELRLFIYHKRSWDRTAYRSFKATLFDKAAVYNRQGCGADSCVPLSSARHFLDFQCPAEIELGKEKGLHCVKLDIPQTKYFHY